jgi:hypothetical protein
LVAARTRRNNPWRFLLLAFLLRLVCQKKSGKQLKKALCRKNFLRCNYLVSTLAFFFGTRGAKKKALQKRNATYATGEQVSSPPTLCVLFRALRGATNAARVGSAQAFEKA